MANNALKHGFFMAIIQNWSFNGLFDGRYSGLYFNGYYDDHVENIYGLFDGR